jgi:hypothetical protein
MLLKIEPRSRDKRFFRPGYRTWARRGALCVVLPFGQLDRFPVGIDFNCVASNKTRPTLQKFTRLLTLCSSGRKTAPLSHRQGIVCFQLSYTL